MDEEQQRDADDPQRIEDLGAPVLSGDDAGCGDGPMIRKRNGSILRIVGFGCVRRDACGRVTEIERSHR